MIQPGAAVAFGHQEQVLQMLPLFLSHAAAQRVPEAFFDPATQLGDEAFQHGYAGQQNLVRQQSGRCPVEQLARTVDSCPAKGVQPATQAKSDTGISKHPIAVTLLNLGGMALTLAGFGMDR